MSSKTWLRVREEMLIVISLLESEYFKKLPLKDQVDLIAKKLAVTRITAWRRIDRYNKYYMYLAQGRKGEAKRIDWH